MNITELAMLKKMLGNSGGGGGASAYTVKSIDELPSNAVDGSVAIVKRDIPNSVAGVWRFKDTITVPNATFDVSHIHNCIEGNIYPALVGNGVDLYNNTRLIDANKIYSANGGWLNEEHKTIWISADYENAEFIAWLNANADKLSGDLYGYWQFNKDISFAGINFEVGFYSFSEVSQIGRYSLMYDDGCFVYENGDDGTVCIVIDEDGVINNRAMTIKVVENATNDFYYWLIANATQIIPPQLYIRENGEWVYKCEVV